MKITFLAGALSVFLLASTANAATNIASKEATPVATIVTQINLNTADASALSKSMKGIGVKRAEAIIKYRETHDGFKSVEDLSMVPLFGKNFVSSHLAEIQKVFSVK